MAGDPGYRLRLGSSLDGGRLIVSPQISAPAGAKLRYEMSSTKEGGAGKSSTSQSGAFTVGAEGSAKLSTLTLSAGPKDRYVIKVKVFEGKKLVAEEVLRHPR